MKPQAIAQQLLEQMTLKERINLLTSTHEAVERLGIPKYSVGGEAAHGIVDRKIVNKTTSFPLPLGLAQTWNKELLKEVGNVIGTEGKIRELQSDKTGWGIYFFPTIDMERDPRWGRNEEAYGEDPYLVGQLVTPFIKGVQGEDAEYVRTATTVKHFYGNNNEQERTSKSNFIPKRAENEYYLKSFANVIQGSNPMSIMTAYNGVNGKPGMQLPELKEYVLGEWGLDGFIICDGGALRANVGDYEYFDNYTDSLVHSLKAGVDCFLDEKDIIEAACLDAYEKGLLTEEEINFAALRVLTVRAKLGHFGTSPFEIVDHTKLNSEEHSEVVRKATEEQIVLLKNDNNFLPLREQSVVAIGPSVNIFPRDWYGGYPSKELTIVDGLQNKYPNQFKGYVTGHDHVKVAVDGKVLGLKDEVLQVTDEREFVCERWADNQLILKDSESNRYLSFDEEKSCYTLHQKEVYSWFVKENIHQLGDNSYGNWIKEPLGLKEGILSTVDEGQNIELIVSRCGHDEAVAKAKEAEVAIVVLGNHPMVNAREEIDRDDITLATHQLELLKKVYEVNKQIVLIVISGYAFDLTWAQKNIPAILYTTYGSQELGDIVAEVIYGKRVPSGKLVQTWFKSVNDLPDIMNYDLINFPRTYHYFEKEVLYPFGYGLTYGKLELNNFEIVLENKDKIIFAVTVYNENIEKIIETLQLYMKPTSKEIPFAKQLIAFEKVIVEDSKIVRFIVQKNQFTFFDVRTQDFQFIPGIIDITVGFSSEDVREKLEIEVSNKLVDQYVRQINEEFPLFAFEEYKSIDIIVNEEKERCLLLKENGYVVYSGCEWLSDSYTLSYYAKEDTAMYINGKEKILLAGSHLLTIDVVNMPTIEFKTLKPIRIDRIVAI